MRPAAALLLSLLLPAVARPDGPPRVVSAGPEGPLDALEQANEIRVTFSEPMVALGRIPERVEAPFVRIEPALAGRFRWSGTTTLVFTPDPGAIRHATRYAVTVDASASSARGAALEASHAFTFTTPTVRLLEVLWFRRGGRFDRPVLLLLRFNQPVAAESLLPQLAVQRKPHAFDAPVLPPDALGHARRVDPRASEAFAARVEAARASASASGPVAVHVASDWDKVRFPPAPELLVLETDAVPPPDTWLEVVVGAAARGQQGTETPGEAIATAVPLEPTLFVDGFRCHAACEPDSWNPLRFRGRVLVAKARDHVRVTDVTEASRATPLPRAKPVVEAVDEVELEDAYAYDHAGALTLEDAGFEVRPARTYAVTVAPGFTAADGQVLGYGWAGLVENWHRRALVSFGGGHGVWEAGGGAVLPFHVRNLRSVTQWLAPLRTDALMPALRALDGRSFALAPGGAGIQRRLDPRPDVVESAGLELEGVLPAGGRGFAWAALREGEPIPRARQDRDPAVKASVVQVTNLGLTVKDSPQNTLVLVTRLDDAEPVAGATVSIRTLDNAVFWSGVTGPDGIAIAPRTPLRDPEREWEFRFVVIAEKDGDAAYVGSDWNEGIAPWAFGLSLDLRESRELLRGTVFPDRGVYRLGEEVRVKVILRDDTPEGIRLLTAGTRADLAVKDSQGREVAKATVTLSDWSSAEWAVTLPPDGALGRYEVSATVAGRRDPVTGSFLVAAYRRPDFRVDAELAGESSLAGVGLSGVVNGRYLFGGVMGGRAVRWTYTRHPLLDVPSAVAGAFPVERWAMLDEDDPGRFNAPDTLQEREDVLDAAGRLAVDLETERTAGRPFRYQFEAEVTDLSRQAIAGRASFRVDPAPWYVGIRRPPFFAGVAEGVDTEIVAAGLDGRAVPGVTVAVTLTRVQWHAVRRAEGGGFYTWESERREVPAGSWEVTTAAEPSPLHVPLPSGGYFVLRASANDAEGRTTTSSVSFYVLGPGFTAWERHDHNRIDLVPEKKRYRPGEEARILVKSPWDAATALVTTEREGIRTHRTFRLRSTQETITVPVGEAAIPNLYVSVVLVKGRTGAVAPADTSDPGTPAPDASRTETSTLARDAGRYSSRSAATVTSSCLLASSISSCA